MSICIEKQSVADFEHGVWMGREVSGWPLLRTWAARWAEWRRRRSLTRLLDLDVHLIDDIGLTHEEIHAALTLPLSRNATGWMHQRAALRRRQEFAARRQRKPVTGLRQW